MALKVIGTGFGRTGTMSLKLALEQLGFDKCYHMYELIQKPHELTYFEKAYNGEKINWDELFSGYQSALDYPVILFYKDLIEKYPEAKIIHTVRDPESWYKSFSDTILWASRPSFGRIFKLAVQLPFSKKKRQLLRLLQFNGKFIREQFGEEFDEKDQVIKVFKEHNNEVMDFIPKDRSLVYDVTSGWEPLCAFLNVPVPDMAFPKSNSTEEFILNVKKT